MASYQILNNRQTKDELSGAIDSYGYYLTHMQSIEFEQTPKDLAKCLGQFLQISKDGLDFLLSKPQSDIEQTIQDPTYSSQICQSGSFDDLILFAV